MLEDLRALVEFAYAGSIAGAAGRLFRTPSAVTRQVQRLEAALGAELQRLRVLVLDGGLQIGGQPRIFQGMNVQMPSGCR